MKVKDITMTAIFAALVAICSWISIPFVVPFTLQTFAVFLSCLLQGGRKSAMSLTIYLLLGAIGVPVFSGFRSGIATLIGPTGGYIVGFPLLCLTYAAFTCFLPHKPYTQILGLFLGLILLYCFGTLWFVFGYLEDPSMTFGLAAAKCVFPFILPDLVKMALAWMIARKIPSKFHT